jgi:hypothetical protein
MATCAHCQSSLFDYVYGLLDEADHQAIYQHISTCAECQTALAKAQAQVNMLASAARVINIVPEFALPSEAPALAPALAPAPATLPLSSSSVAETAGPGLPPASAPAPRRPLWKRPVVAWASAAAILLALGTSIASYHARINSYDRSIAQQRREYREVEDQLAALPAKYKAQQQVALADLRTVAPHQLHVIGPVQLLPGAGASLEIVTRDADGEPAKSKVSVKLIDSAGHNLLARNQVDSTGRIRFDIGADKAGPNSKLNLIVESSTPAGRAHLEQSLHVAQPEYAPRIDINKIVYQIKETVYFRVLLLDRFLLTPPGQPMLLRVELRNPANDIVKETLMWTGDGGILAGELPIEDQFLAGSYVLRVAPIEPAQGVHAACAAAPTAFFASSMAGLCAGPLNHGSLSAALTLIPGRTAAVSVQTASQRFEVVRQPLPPRIRFDKEHYLPGEIVTGTLPGVVPPGSATLTINDQRVAVAIEPAAGRGGMMPMAIARPGVTGGAGGGIGGFDKKKTLPMAPSAGQSRFSAQLPKNVPAGASAVPMTLQYQNGSRKEELRAAVPLVPTEHGIDFYPEGGELVAGVLNRVFFRIRAGRHDAFKGDGHVLLISNSSEIVDAPYHLGQGYFEFTPGLTDAYTVRITTPMKTTELKQPFSTILRSSGLVLQVSKKLDGKDVPAAVGKQGEPIPVTLRLRGPKRQLLLVAECRGQIVDQRWCDMSAGVQEVVLQPAAAQGMIRVTAYEFRGGVLEPLAERLVYRAAARGLDLGIALSTQQHQPGQPLQAKISSRSEQGAPAPCWMLASVVAEPFQPTPRSLSAYYLLLNEIHARANLEDAQLIQHDSPVAAPMLETFLGTRGWRRFVPAGKDAGPNPQANDVCSAPAIFSRENMSLEALQQQYQQQRTARLAPVQQQAFGEQRHLQDHQEHLAAALNATMQGRALFEAFVRQSIGLVAGLLLALLLAASLILLFLGVVRIMRGYGNATPSFGGAFACLAVCLVMMLVGRVVVSLDSIEVAWKPHGPAALDQQNRLAQQLAQAQIPRRRGELLAEGAFAPQAVQPSNARVEADRADGRPTEALAMNEQAALTLADRERAAPRLAAAMAIPQGAGSSSVDNRGSAVPAGPAIGSKIAAKVSPNPVPAVAPTPMVPHPAPAAPLAKASKEESGTRFGGAMTQVRQHAHQYAPNQIADTLFWSPALWLADGSAEVRFDIASGRATYRVLLMGHSPTGQFGFYDMRLDVPVAER